METFYQLQRCTTIGICIAQNPKDERREPGMNYMLLVRSIVSSYLLLSNFRRHNRFSCFEVHMTFFCFFYSLVFGTRDQPFGTKGQNI